MITRSSKRQKGVTMIEYALIAAFISVVAIGSLTTAKTQVSTIWANIASALLAGA